MRNDRGYTYLITNGKEYKIGITTKTPVSIVAELQTGSPTKITISGYSYNSNALEMEQWLHLKFSNKRLEGEWFALNDDDVAIIHYHFETNHLDEYLAPLSARGVEAKRKEDKEKAKREIIYKDIQAKEREQKEKEKEQKQEIKKLTAKLVSITRRQNIFIVGIKHDGTELYPIFNKAIREKILKENKKITIELLKHLIEEKEIFELDLERKKEELNSERKKSELKNKEKHNAERKDKEKHKFEEYIIRKQKEHKKGTITRKPGLKGLYKIISEIEQEEECEEKLETEKDKPKK